MTNTKKNQNLLQEKNNHVLKSWKTYAIAAGVIVIGTGIGIGVYYGVNANANTVQRITDQDISNAIHNTNYALTKSVESQASVVESEINAGFIQEQLAGQFKSAFNAGLFSRNGKIMVQESQEMTSSHALTDADLATTGTINAKIKYNYGEVKGQELNLKITVTNVFVPTDENIWQKIIDTNYQLTIASGTTAAELNVQIPNIIQDQLPDVYKKYFEYKKLTLANVYKKVDNKPITIVDNDLKEPGINTFWIQFGYGSVGPNGETEIEITLT